MMTDSELLDAIDQERWVHGACTYRGLARELGYSPTAVRYRVQKLMAAGLVRSLGTGGIMRVEPQPPPDTILLRVQYTPGAERLFDVTVVDGEAG
mgnify:CR=1 FL=1